MNSIIVQIYEVQDPEEAGELIEIGVDNIGSVLVSEENWKFSNIKETIDLTDSTNSQSSLIPLFSNQDSVFRALEFYMPDIVHFCEDIGQYRGAYGTCEDLMVLQGNIKEKFPEIKIMRSIPIGEEGKSGFVPTLELAGLFESVSDYFLTDTLIVQETNIHNCKQPVKNFVGITGVKCDWGTASKLVKHSNIPVILAGGISPENVSDGITTVRPYGIDSCTNTNAMDNKGKPVRFKKDMLKVKRLVDEVRNTAELLRFNSKTGGI